MGEEFVVTALSVPKHLFKISHLSNVYQSCCLEANSCSCIRIPNTGNNLEHRCEGQFEEATKANFKIQLCVEGLQELRFFFLDLKQKARIIPHKISEFRRCPKLYLEQICLSTSGMKSDVLKPCMCVCVCNTMHMQRGTYLTYSSRLSTECRELIGQMVS